MEAVTTPGDRRYAKGDGRGDTAVIVYNEDLKQKCLARFEWSSVQRDWAISETKGQSVLYVQRGVLTIVLRVLDFRIKYSLGWVLHSELLTFSIILIAYEQCRVARKM